MVRTTSTAGMPIFRRAFARLENGSATVTRKSRLSCDTDQYPMNRIIHFSPIRLLLRDYVAGIGGSHFFWEAARKIAQIDIEGLQAL